MALTHSFNCVKGISDGLVLSVGPLKEKKKEKKLFVLPLKVVGIEKKCHFTLVLPDSRYLGTLSHITC